MMCLNREEQMYVVDYRMRESECLSRNQEGVQRSIPRYKTQDIGLKFHSYPPQVQETSLGTSKSNNDNYLRRGTE
jgi:hypothetical protein